MRVIFRQDVKGVGKKDEIKKISSDRACGGNDDRDAGRLWIIRIIR